MLKSYNELVSFDEFKDRFEYLKIGGRVGRETFGSHRYLNQALYSSQEWKRFRRDVIIRDSGWDMAMKGHLIEGDQIIVHHINPLSVEDILSKSPRMFDLDNVVCVSYRTHKAIHYGSFDLLPEELTERKPGDTCPWR